MRCGPRIYSQSSVIFVKPCAEGVIKNDSLLTSHLRHCCMSANIWELVLKLPTCVDSKVSLTSQDVKSAYTHPLLLILPADLLLHQMKVHHRTLV